MVGRRARYTNRVEAGFGRRQWLQAGFVAAIGLAAVATYEQAGRRAAEAAVASTHRPIEQTGDGYVSSDECRSCHPSEYDSWARSYHRTMTTVATPEHVRGDFEVGSLLLEGEPYPIRADGDRFLVRADARGPAPRSGPNEGRTTEDGLQPLSLVTGSHHMQIYWYELGRGRALGQFPFAYLIEDQRWVPRNMIFLRPPSALRVSESERWNNTCLHCHATHAQPLPGTRGEPDTRVGELGIACEACHGPGAEHVARFQSPLARYQNHLGDPQPTAITNPSELDHERASQICSQCHAMWQFDRDAFIEWSKHGLSYRPGEDPDESMWLFSPSRAGVDRRVADVLRDHPKYAAGQFWSDGQARVSGREYHGMSDSGCFTRGEMSCMSCHDMHDRDHGTRGTGGTAAWADDQLGAGMDDDRACLQCHGELARDLTAHTRHPAESSGSRCYNCHMPYTSYGLLKAIRSHKVTSPSARETAETGRPNACNMCHLDRSLSWTAQQLEARFGVKGSVPSEAGRDDDVSLAAALSLRGDAGQRALMAWAFGWKAARAASGDAWMPAFLGALMDDPYDAVRYIAERSLRSYPEHAAMEYDFVPRPHQRAPVASDVARRAGAGLGEVPAAVPLTPGGQLDGTAEGLLSRRDHTQVNLLE